MRLLLLTVLGLLTFVNCSSLQEIRFQIYSTSDDEFDSILQVGRRIHADNKHIAVVSEVVNCIKNASPLPCSEVTDKDIILVISNEDIVEKYVISNVEEAKHVDFVQSAFTDFFEKYYTFAIEKSHELDNHNIIESLWDVFATSSYKDLTEKSSLGTMQLLKEFIQSNQEEKVFFILQLNKASFTGFPYLLYSLDMSLSTNFKLGIIDCLDTPELCSDDAQVSSLISYKGGNKYKVYDGNLDYPSMKDWAKKLANPILSVLSSDIVPMYRSGIVPGFEEVQHTVNMLFISTKKHQVYKDYLEFAKQNHGKFHLTVMVEKEISKWPNQPAFITMKPLEQVSKAFVKFKDITYESMAHYITTGIHPAIHELNSPQSILTALSIPAPLTIFVDPSKLKDQHAFAKLASEHPVRQNTSEFAVVTGNNVLGSYFVRAVGFDMLNPSYVLINKDRTCIFVKRIVKENRDEILHWINSCQKKPCTKDIDFDFNQIIDLIRWEQYGNIKKLLNVKQSRNMRDEL